MAYMFIILFVVFPIAMLSINSYKNKTYYNFDDSFFMKFVKPNIKFLYLAILLFITGIMLAIFGY